MSPEASPQKMNHRIDIQGLRAVAIIAVLLFHIYPEYWTNGYLGVDIFFVISGYLIFSTLNRAVERESLCLKTSLQFYNRRVSRILPNSLVFMVFAAVLLMWQKYPERLKPCIKEAWRAFFFSTNIFSMIDRNDYFETVHGESLFTHIWSLSVEMQFYLIVPLLFVIRNLLLPQSLRSWCFPVISLISLIAYVMSPSLYSFNVPLLRIWQFFAVTFFEFKILKKPTILQHKKPSETDVEKSLLPHLAVTEDAASECSEESVTSMKQLCQLFFVRFLYGYSLLLLVLPLLAFVTIDPTLSRIAVTAATAFIVAFGDEIETPLLSNDIFTYVGDSSYSIYLFHWPFTAFLVGTSYVASWTRFSAMTSSIAIATMVYEFFERKYRKWTGKETLIGCSILSVAFCAVMFSGPYVNYHIHALPAHIERVVLDNEYALSHGRLWPRSYVKYENYKNLSAPEGISRWPNGNGRLRFSVIGNSYAEEQTEMIYKAFKHHMSSYETFAQWSCEPLAWTIRKWCFHKANFTDVLDIFNKPDVVFIVQRFFRAKIDPLPVNGEVDGALEEMKSYLDLFMKQSKLIFLLDAQPATHLDNTNQVNDMLKNGTDIGFINQAMLLEDDVLARIRVQKLLEYCKQCRLYDYRKLFEDKGGKFWALNSTTGDLWLNHWSHLTPLTMGWVEEFYKTVEVDYRTELEELANKLYGKL